MKMKDLNSANPTFNVKRRKLNVPELIKRKAIFITDAHDVDGWEVNDEDWNWSIITLHNYIHSKNDKQDSWIREAPKHLKPKSYADAAETINSNDPNLRISDQKYNQILWSIKKLKISPEIAFLD